eukprot:571018-Amphidinium_carterae.1
MDGTREQHLEAVKRDGRRLRYVPEPYRADREIVLWQQCNRIGVCCCNMQQRSARRRGAGVVRIWTSLYLPT